jgi:uncharacterized protein
VKIEGKYEFKAPREQVYAVLISPQALQACIPGCKRFEAVGTDQYEVTMEVGVASIKGTYNGKARLADQDPPNRLKLIVEGSGSAGWVRGEGTLLLEDRGTTTGVAVEGDATVGGLVASVGQRLIGGVAKKMVAQFFDCMQEQLAVTPKAATEPEARA